LCKQDAMTEMQSIDVSQPVDFSHDRPRIESGIERLSDCLSIPNNHVGRVVRSCLERYESKACADGMKLEMHTDFHHFADVVAALGKGPVTPQFDIEVSDIGPVNAFWLKGVNSQGEIAQVQAVRMDDLSGDSLTNHCRSLKVFYSDPEASAHPGESCDVGSPASHAITGIVVYMGEFWIKGGDNGYRGHKFATILPLICMAIALVRWSPDFVYATTSPVLVEKGLIARYGFPNAQPHGIIWNAPHYGEILDEWLMWMSWRELVDRIERS
jgi:hypothetical protein